MTREKAIKILSVVELDDRNVTDETIKAIRMAIKALEQQSILDKIRAEIKLLSNANPSYWHSGDMVDRDDVLEIIDNYRESEDDKE